MRHVRLLAAARSCPSTRSPAARLALVLASALVPAPRAEAGRVDFAAPRLAAPGAAGQTFVADLDGDGRADLVAVDTAGTGVPLGAPLVRVQRGSAEGRFAEPAIAVPVPDPPGRAALADFDGDGRLDLAVVSRNGRRIHVLGGLGDGRFAPLGSSYVSLGAVERLATGDLDGDGSTDLVAATGHSITLLLQDAAGGFVPARTESMAPHVVTSLAVGDADTDGRVDVLVGSFTGCDFFQCFGGRLRTYFGDGRGGFRWFSDRNFTSRVSAVALLDFGGDGFDDLAVAQGGSESYEFEILRGRGRGAFDPWIRISTGSLDDVPVAADVDGDGRTDVAALSDAARIDVALDGSGGVVRDVRRTVVFGKSLSLGDVDGDGRLDAVVTAKDGATVYRGRGDGTFAAPAEVGAIEVPFAPTVVASFDLNEDGRPDLVAGAADRTAMLLSRRSSGDFVTSLLSGTLATTLPGDYDGDGHEDLVFQTSPRDGSRAEVRYGNGRGQFSPYPSRRTAAARPSTVDFDEDGVQDLVLNVPAQRARAYLGNGDGTLREAVVPGLEVVGRLVAADFDADGHLDVGQVVLNPWHAGPSVHVFAGDGRGGFAAAVTTPLPSAHSESVAVADFDEDGFPDLAFDTWNLNEYPFPDSVSLWFGRGDGTFREGPAVSGAADECRRVATADVDADGHADLVLSHLASLTIRRGDGRGGFGRPIGFRLRSGVAGVVASDVDADGDADLAAVLEYDRSVVVVTNESFIAYLDARAGNVNFAAGEVADILFVNGSAGSGRERRVAASTRAPLVIDVLAPPSTPFGPAPMAVWFWEGSPRPGTAHALPRRLGYAAMPTPIDPFRSPQPRLVANSLGFPARLGREKWPGPPTLAAPTRLLGGRPILPRRGTYYVQGIIRDPAGYNGSGAVTNGVEIVVRD